MCARSAHGLLTQDTNVTAVPRTSFVTRYDFRAPGATPEQRRELFARALEQAAYVDAHGHDALMLSEHHVSEDGYLPSPIPVAAAFAAVTTRIPISIAALLVNLYDPLRLAEDIAVLDHWPARTRSGGCRSTTSPTTATCPARSRSRRRSPR